MTHVFDLNNETHADWDMHTKIFIEILKHTNLIRICGKSCLQKFEKQLDHQKWRTVFFQGVTDFSNFAIAFPGYPAGLVFGGDTQIDSPENQLKILHSKHFKRGYTRVTQFDEAKSTFVETKSLPNRSFFRT